KHLLPKAMSAMGIKDKELEVTDDAIRTMIDSYTMEGGVRGLKKVLDTLCRSCAVEIANGRKDTLVINQDNLKAYLDARPIHHDRVLKNDQPGIVTGLAWTAAGGEILFIESLMMKGTGKVTVTGQLGDVMKESVSIAMSLVRHRFPDKADVFANHDIHIHVPEGAVKKDGPSAGITLTTALASLVTGHPVDPSIGMTGEVSLRGKVMEIGGLPEKLMAAARAGVKTVLIPKDNVDDLKDVPQEARDALKIVPVDTVEDVLKYTGIIA
ncbi:MAG: S16 family serine protease, partial [Lactimicrobium massiliense]